MDFSSVKISTGDIVVVVLYFLSVIGIGIYTSKVPCSIQNLWRSTYSRNKVVSTSSDVGTLIKVNSNDSINEFFLGGRKFSWGLVGLSHGLPFVYYVKVIQ